MSQGGSPGFDSRLPRRSYAEAVLMAYFASSKIR